MKRRSFLAVAVGLALGALQLPVAAQSPIDPSVKRVLFLGDSITYAGQYVDYVEAAYRLKYPESKVEFLDLGLPSETVSGLSEPGHAGGKFPRPDLHERLDRVLAQVQPQLVIACYGMNDGIYYPFSPERFLAFETGMIKLHDKVVATGAKIIHLTPPVFDAQPIKAKTLPAGRDVYEQPFEGYDQVLAQYSDWLLSQKNKGWVVYDIHGPMLKHLQTRRAESPDFKFAGDGVHADANGHWLMAEALLKGWDLKPNVEVVRINAKQRRVELGRASELESKKDYLAFTWKTRLAPPLDPKWDEKSLLLENFEQQAGRRELKVTELPAGKYELKEDGQVLGQYTDQEFRRGIVLSWMPKSAMQRVGNELLKFISQRRKLLSDAWLTATEHKRPGMAKGLPLAEADVKAADLEKRIRDLTKPITIKLELEKVDEAKK